MNSPQDLASRFDVAIAGAGLAGGSLALRLARAGARVALIDAGRFPRDKLCGEFLSPESGEVLEQLGLAADVEQSSYHAIRHVRLSTPRGRMLDVEFQGRDGRPGIGLSRSVLDELLVRHARTAGVIVLEGTRVVGPVISEGRVIGVEARQGADAAFEVRAEVTVAADGRHSALVKKTGKTQARGRFRERLFGMKHHVEANGPEAEPPGTVGLHLVPGGYGGTCRIEPPLTNFCALLPESILHQHRGQIDRVVSEFLSQNPRLDRFWSAARPVGEWKTVAGVRVETSKPNLAGILYAGDCQGTIDPLGGQGMTMALRGAEVLAAFVLEALATGHASAALQQRYDAAWHQRFDHRIRLCRMFHHVLVRPGLIDVASTFKTLAPRLLAACFAQTRD